MTDKDQKKKKKKKSDDDLKIHLDPMEWESAEKKEKEKKES